MIVNHDIKLEQFIDDSKSLIICKDDQKSWRLDSINSRIYFIKNNEFNIKFIDKIFELWNILEINNKFPYEQRAMQIIYDCNLLNIKENILIHDENAFNSYYPHTKYKDWDFILNIMINDINVKEIEFDKFYSKIKI